MQNKNAFTKFLAILGTILAWLPVVAPLFFGIVVLIRAGLFRFDYLMPAEGALLVLVGGLLLLWAALRARTLRALIGWTLGVAVLLLFGSQAVAVVTGLAQGTVEATGWQFAIVLGMLIAYDLAVVLLGIEGIVLVRRIFGRNQELGMPADADISTN